MSSFQGVLVDIQGREKPEPTSQIEKDIPPVHCSKQLTSDSTQSQESPIPSKHLEQLSLKDLREIAPDLGRLQKRRLSLFEPFSLPSSRVPSIEPPLPTNAPQQPSHNLSVTPSVNPQSSSPMHSPPLTPAQTHDKLGTHQNGLPSKIPAGDPAAMTPQVSPPPLWTANSGPKATIPLSSSAQSSRSSSPHKTQQQGQLYTPRPAFSIGPPERTSSHDSSSAATPATTPPATSGYTTPTFFPQSRPFTPAGEQDDPYARSKRPPQNKNPNEIEPRFIFNRASSKEDTRVHRHSHLSLHNLVKKGDSSSSLSTHKAHSSMSELKRFFKPLKRSSSPGFSKSSRSSTYSPLSAPFSDDHGLTKKYGKFGKVLGTGAGGSVRLMKRSSDGVTFAVKQFRARHNYESEREYSKKVTAEFCIGSTLHHGNIIETLDIVQEKGKWYEVMEYCPFDLFATVMTGKMSKEEVSCSFAQILNGVTYLHGVGLAHRDLKLDNVVINEYGVLKIIDFGSATVFRYPFENDIVMACGIVGSDPYLAPEVCNDIKYDPQPADIWSLAIIYCCMQLRRFPWKAPRQSEKSFKLFSTKPDPVDVPAALNANPASMTSSSSNLPTSKSHQQRPNTALSPPTAPNQQGAESNSVSAPTSRVPSGTNNSSTNLEGDNDVSTHPPSNSPITVTVSKDGEIKGPFRLLRLLPRESRHIIGRMLELDPKKRATLKEIWDDDWIKSIQMCHQEEDGTVIKAANHVHTLEGQTGGSAESSRKSTK